MALITANVRSHVMDLETQIFITIPDYQVDWHEKPTKVLYLLHGLTNNASAWIRGSNIDRYAEERGFIVVMPEVNRSFYSDMVYGPDYFTYITKELPVICKNMFGIDHKKEDTFIAGLSMGGYGALKAGLTFPEKFAGIGSLSGVVDLNRIMALETADMENPTKIVSEFFGIFGQEVLKTKKTTKKDNIKELLLDSDRLKAKPRIYLSCGTEDFLYNMNSDMRDYINSLSYDFKYFEGPGEHTWYYWDQEIQKCMDYFIES